MFFATENKRIKNMNDIKDIFTESNELGTEYFISSENGGYNLNGRPFLEDTATSRISTLSELFTEWFLFDSSHKKSIEQFLTEEKLNDVFSESEFMDLMCGNAYLDKELLFFIKMKLPFYISPDKLEHINSLHNKKAFLIPHTQTVVEKNQELVTQYLTNRKEQTKKRKEKYRATHREQIREYDRVYRAAHLERAKEREAQYRETHKEQRKQRDKRYYATNKEMIQKKQKEYYQRNKKLYLARRKEYYAAHTEECKKSCKEYYQKNKEKWKEYRSKEDTEKRKHTKKAYYEANKEECLQRNKKNYVANKEKYLAQQKLYYQEQKQKIEIAKTVCAAYVFLLNLKKTNKEQYSKLYTRQQNPLIGMFKTCIALQNNDIQLCPFCNENCTQKPEQCCNQKILSIPNAIIEIQSLANTLKQR